MNIGTSTFKMIVSSGRKPYALARELCLLDDRLPMLVGMLVYQSTPHIAEVAIEVVRRITNSPRKGFAVTVFDRCVFLEELEQAKPDRLAMAVTRRADVDDLSEAIAFTATQLDRRGDNE